MKKPCKICPECGSGNAYKMLVSQYTPSRIMFIRCQICDMQSEVSRWVDGRVVTDPAPGGAVTHSPMGSASMDAVPREDLSPPAFINLSEGWEKDKGPR